MVSIIGPAVILMTTVFAVTQADENSSGEKIIIHVPYKIHNHLHTHTNYKVIKVPENTAENIHEASQNEEEIKYVNKEIQSILSGTKIPHVLKDTETQFKPQTFPNIHDEQPIIPIPEVHEPKGLSSYRALHGKDEAATEHVITAPTRVPGFHTTIPDYQFGEGKVYIHTFSTQPPFVPFYNAEIVNPTYHVEEQQTSDERISSPVKSFDSFPKVLTKTHKDPSFVRNYLKKNPYNIRSGKYIPTTKSIKLPTTKLYSLPTISTKHYSLPTIATKKYAIPTSKSFVVPTTKVPKTLFKHNAEYEHIGYLVVGENSQKFVSINDKNN